MNPLQDPPGGLTCGKSVWIIVLMTPKRHRITALDVWARRQIRARANHRRAGAHEVACDVKLDGQLVPAAVSM